MPGTNLTRDEAAARGALLRVTSYEIELDLTRGDEIFGSTTTIRFAASRPGTATFVDLIAPRVHAVTLNGRTLDPVRAYRDGRIELDALASGNELRVVADCAYSRTGQGLHRSVDPADGRVYTFTHFEVPDARRVFATFEQPDLKAPVTFTVTAPDGWTVLSNSATPDPEPAGAGAARWRFAATPPIATYLTAVVAGGYHVVRDTHTTPSGQVIPLGLACRASLAAHLDAEHLFEVTRQGFDHYADQFGRDYPFAKYDQVFVPEFNIGAMENAGCVTVAEGYLFRSKATDARYQARAGTLLHEMAHMWFGDLVTMRWWDDLWLKESFATYVATRAVAEATRWTGAWTTFATSDKAWGYLQDQLPSTHPILADIGDLEDVGVNFDGITYAKGAGVLKQLVAWVGADQFRAGIRDYLDQHAWGNTTLADLLAALERASGRDLDGWSRAWLRSAGANILAPEFSVDPDGTFRSFAVIQRAPAAHPTLRPHRIAIGLYRRGPAGLTRTERVELDVAGERTGVPELAGVTRPDLVLLNDDDLSFARVRFDDRSLSTMLAAIGEFTEPLPRAVCWTAAWDMVRDAELPAADYVRMVLGGVDAETDIGILESLHRNLVTAIECYLAPSRAAAAAAQVAGAARSRLDRVAPGSDVQLAWATLLARTARTGHDLALVAALLDGSQTVDGLVVDTDLRWSLLAALARNGRADESMIEAELARDHTTTGTENAAGIRAALPLAAAKADAWAAVVDRDDLPNGTRSAIIGGPGSRIGAGFAQAGQEDLLRPYVDRYFETVRHAWLTRPIETARRTAAGLYPWRIIEPETVARTDEFLARPDLPPALRRLVTEGRDGVVRALRARDADRDGGQPVS